MKTCTVCRLEKPDGEFYKDATKPLGVSRLCKPCTLAERARYRSANRERLKLQARADRRRTPERGCWQAMIDRCHDPKSTYFAHYGGRGIRVCNRWRESFALFQADMGPRPSPIHSLDRIDNDGNYEPGNVRWATPREQGRNKRNNRMLTAFGRTQCLTDWAAERGLRIITLKDRLDKLGWDVERALTAPLKRGRAA
jgi:hypothetical protein